MNLTGRDFLREADFTPAEIVGLLDLAAELKAQRRAGTERQQLVGKQIALIFEKTSTRTRISFEVAINDQGGHATVLDPSATQVGHKESIPDTARVLSRLYDAIEYRGSGHHKVERLAEFADVPVYNGLTDEWHPTQMLADFLTMREHAADAAAPLCFAYIGDARNNMGNSLLVTAAILGADCRLVAPKSLWPSEAVQTIANKAAAASGARLLITEDVEAGVRGAEFIHTDVWVSMGESSEVWDERVNALRPYRVTEQTLAMTGRSDVKFMHCLPAYHDQSTPVGRQAAQSYGLVDGVEVTNGVFEGPHSIVWDQGENRLHTIEALLVATMGDTETGAIRG